MSAGETNKTIQFTVSLSPASGAIYDAVKGREKFYRSKRLVHLATLGLMVEQGAYTAAHSQPSQSPDKSATSKKTIPEKPPEKVDEIGHAHYKLPSAESLTAMETMFDNI